MLDFSDRFGSINLPASSSLLSSSALIAQPAVVFVAIVVAFAVVGIKSARISVGRWQEEITIWAPFGYCSDFFPLSALRMLITRLALAAIQIWSSGGYSCCFSWLLLLLSWSVSHPVIGPRYKIYCIYPVKVADGAWEYKLRFVFSKWLWIKESLERTFTGFFWFE